MGKVTINIKDKKPKPWWRYFWNPNKVWYKNFFFSDIKDVILFLIVLFGVWAYHHDVAVYKDVFENPCDYCGTCHAPVFNVSDDIKPDFVFVFNDSS